MLAFIIRPAETLIFFLIVAVIAIPVILLALAAAKWIKKSVLGSEEPLIGNRTPQPPASPYRDREAL